tara:strand:- start:154 stop:345 length:192 start_codon:yes stop_codon:yes gene_type:complete
MGCLFSSNLEDDIYASLLEESSILYKPMQEEINKLIVKRLITLEENIVELSKDIHYLGGQSPP